MAVRKSEVSLSIRAFLLLVVLALGLAAFYRFPGLEKRPMHTDEAILAVKLGEFWNSGQFDYDPKDYHGPALHQVSWLWGKLRGWGDPNFWSEAQVRVVVAVCGMVLLVAILLVADGLGRFGTALAMLLTAVSPMMVFYSRYFIMEMLLVLLVTLFLASLWRYAQGGSRLWLLVAGAALGFQHATKETFILNLGAAACGWIAAQVLVRDFTLTKKRTGMSLGPVRRQTRPARPWLWVAIPAVAVSIASFSDGFKDWHAVKDSVITYWSYIDRSGGSGHEKPWHYYLTLMFWRKDTWVWSEALIGGLGIVGIVNAFLGHHKSPGRQAFLIFLSVYTLALFTVYSLLRYKTPWTILAAQHALTLLAGVGGGALWEALTTRFTRLVFTVLLAAGMYNLCDRSMLSINEYRADPRNPYVYSHTSTNITLLLNEMAKLRREHGKDLKVQVISRDAGWPMRWYWRAMPNVSYATDVPETIAASVIVADSNLVPAVKEKLAGRDFDERNGLFGLRPNVFLSLLVEKPNPPMRAVPQSLPVPIAPVPDSTASPTNPPATGAPTPETPITSVPPPLEVPPAKMPATEPRETVLLAIPAGPAPVPAPPPTASPAPAPNTKSVPAPNAEPAASPIAPTAPSASPAPGQRPAQPRMIEPSVP